MLGAFLPSSRYLTRHLMSYVNWSATRVVVEYGPGVGTLTTEILRRLRPDGILIAIERNPDFVRYMRENIKDKRLIVHEGSAEEVRDVLAANGASEADCIISGIPYSVLPPHVRDNIMHNSREVLRSGGVFLVYQYTSAILPHMRQIFGDIRTETEFRNIVPARIFCATV